MPMHKKGRKESCQGNNTNIMGVLTELVDSNANFFTILLV